MGCWGSKNEVTDAEPPQIEIKSGNSPIAEAEKREDDEKKRIEEKIDTI